MNRPPQVRLDFETLPTNPKERHEILVSVFGEYLFWVRNETLRIVRERGESVDKREGMGLIFRREFDEIAKLSHEDRERAYAFAERTMDMFARGLLTMIAGQGFDDRMGSRHAFRFRLNMEICDIDTGIVVFEEIINRNGEKFFPEYWGRWISKFLDSKSSELEQ